MAKAIVILSDGTGNTSSKGVSNVYRLVELLLVNEPRRQVIVYDEGIGTPRSGLRQARALEQEPDAKGFHVLDGPLRLGPINFLLRPFESAFGLGLTRNVKQLYRALAERYEDGDTVYFFGFSRGAFTVRALAGLIHRCGLPQRDTGDFNAVFGEAWNHFTPIEYRKADVDDWRHRRVQRRCVIHFLGLWDTVKSYGGLRPRLLPHLRHNPIVKSVRHAIALDEKRGWFNVTTWGRLDLDFDGAMTRIPPHDLEEIRKQDIREVWFRGCHSDIGGGDKEEGTAIIARQWMFAEACDPELPFVKDGGQRLLISDAGRRLLSRALAKTVRKGPPDETSSQPGIHESLTRAWSFVDLVPRREIDNSGMWPRRRKQQPGELHAYRSPELLLRDGTVTMHESVGDVPVGRKATIVGTRLRSDRVNEASVLDTLAGYKTDVQHTAG
jgi:uncharacterized protein (DUF2235 family)